MLYSTEHTVRTPSRILTCLPVNPEKTRATQSVNDCFVSKIVLTCLFRIEALPSYRQAFAIVYRREVVNGALYDKITRL